MSTYPQPTVTYMLNGQFLYVTGKKNIPGYPPPIITGVLFFRPKPWSERVLFGGYYLAGWFTSRTDWVLIIRWSFTPWNCSLHHTSDISWHEWVCWWNKKLIYVKRILRLKSIAPLHKIRGCFTFFVKVLCLIRRNLWHILNWSLECCWPYLSGRMCSECVIAVTRQPSAPAHYAVLVVRAVQSGGTRQAFCGVWRTGQVATDMRCRPCSRAMKVEYGPPLCHSLTEFQQSLCKHNQ